MNSTAGFTSNLSLAGLLLLSVPGNDSSDLRDDDMLSQIEMNLALMASFCCMKRGHLPKDNQT